MLIRTKRFLLRAATAVAVTAAAALILLPGAASAAPATAIGNVDVHKWAWDSSPIVDSLYRGETVDVRGCRSGWCYVTHTGPDGFVPSTSLRAGGATMSPNFNLKFQFPEGSFSIGTGGASLTIGKPPNSGYDNVCFYSGSHYTGSVLCVEQGDRSPYIGAAWNNRISSIRNRSGLRVTVCDDAGYDDCRTYTTSASTLGSFDNKISSYRVK